MNSNEISNIALEIQKQAEAIHCASAIIAVENKMRANIKRNFIEKINALIRRMRTCTFPKDSIEYRNLALLEADLYKDLTKDLSNMRIRVTYAPVERTLAGETLSAKLLNQFKLKNEPDGSCTIVLPQQFQERIDEGLGHDLSGTWTERMVNAKEWLRFLALHELFHVLDKTATEEEANEFANCLLALRKDRLKMTQTDVD